MCALSENPNQKVLKVSDNINNAIIALKGLKGERAFIV